MNIDNVLIMSAGFGTRMGDVGKKLPKVLWPIFETTLLDYQIQRARKYNPGKIYINLHHQYQAITDHFKVRDIKDIVLVHEKEILGTGGATHNIKKLFNLKGKLLILNSDLFYFFDKEWMIRALEKSDEHVATLFLVTVDGSGYTETVFSGDRLMELKPEAKLGSATYSGMSIINLDMLDSTDGYSDFFESIADYKTKNVAVVYPDEYEYCDFGTSKRYYNSMFRVLENKYPMLRDSLLKEGFLNLKKMSGESSYGTDTEECILLDEAGKPARGSIVIRGDGATDDKMGIWFDYLCSPVNQS